MHDTSTSVFGGVGKWPSIIYVLTGKSPTGLTDSSVAYSAVIACLSQSLPSVFCAAGS